MALYLSYHVHGLPLDGRETFRASTSFTPPLLNSVKILNCPCAAASEACRCGGALCLPGGGTGRKLAHVRMKTADIPCENRRYTSRKFPVYEKFISGIPRDFTPYTGGFRAVYRRFSRSIPAVGHFQGITPALDARVYLSTN